MKVALIQLAYGDDESVADRTARVVDLVRAQAGHDLVVLPELWAAGGFDYTAWGARAETVDGPVAQALAGAARDARVTLHGGSIVERAEVAEALEPAEDGRRGLWNTSLVFSPDGELVATYRKIHRFGFGEGEPTLMDAGEDLVVVDVPVAGGGSVPVGLSTCYDLRFPELYRRLLERGAEVFVIPAAWPRRRVEHWTLLGRARAVEDQCVVLQCNTAGTHARHEMGGHSQVVDATGKVLVVAGLDEEVLSIEIDTGATPEWRRTFPVLADRRLR
jgi:predicted amidohydrolase